MSYGCDGVDNVESLETCPLALEISYYGPWLQVLKWPMILKETRFLQVRGLILLGIPMKSKLGRKFSPGSICVACQMERASTDITEVMSVWFDLYMS